MPGFHRWLDVNLSISRDWYAQTCGGAREESNQLYRSEGGRGDLPLGCLEGGLRSFRWLGLKGHIRQVRWPGHGLLKASTLNRTFTWCMWAEEGGRRQAGRWRRHQKDQQEWDSEDPEHLPMKRTGSVLRGVRPLQNCEWGTLNSEQRWGTKTGSRERETTRRLVRKQLLVTPGNPIPPSSLYRQRACMWYICIHAGKTPIHIKW